MAPYVKKNLRGNWRSEDMKAAMRAVAQGKKINTASKEFRVPRRTLKRYIANKQETKSRLGRRTLLTPLQENDLKSRIKRLASVGYPVTPKFLKMTVYRFCQLNNIKIPAPTEGKGMIGRDWLKGYMKRHPDISLRKSQKLNPARAQKLNEFVVKDHFQKLKEVMTRLDVVDKPAQIYNIDEKGCQLMLHKSPQVLAQKGVKRVHIRASEHAENVTVVSCGNAMGNTVPPMILFKGKRKKPEWQDNLPPATLVEMTPKGSMNTDTFIKWIEHFAKFKTPGPCLLIFDGASSHLDYDIVEVAEKHGITLFCLPSNTTHELQPMDKAVFRAFEHYWDQELLKFWFQNKDKTLTKQRFGLIFTPVWDKALTPSNIKSGFEATGIYPFNPNRIPECAYAPSIPSFLSSTREQHETDVTLGEESSAAIINAASDLDNAEFDSEDDVPLSLLRSSSVAQTTATAGIVDHHEVQPSTSSCSVRPRPSAAIGNTNNIADVPDNQEVQKPSTPSCAVQPRPADTNNIADVPDNQEVQRPSTPSCAVQPRPADTNNIADVPDNQEVQRPSTPSCAVQPRPADTNNIADVPDNQEVQRPSTPACAVQPRPADTNNIADVPDHREAQPSSSSPSVQPRPSTSLGNTMDTGNTSFTEMLQTPEKVPTNTTPRRKAINSLAQQLKKDMFSKKDRAAVSAKTTDKAQRKKRKTNQSESWYCFICKEDRVADMRLCTSCSSYIHEECVGLTAADKESYLCPNCED